MLRLILATLFRAGEIELPTKATAFTTTKTQPRARRGMVLPPIADQVEH